MRLGGEKEGVPKYIQLAQIIREKIVRREYGVGERIPSETELGSTYRMSRITVRQAIDRLVRDGFLERRQGRGTYVLPRKLRRNIARVYSFTSDMQQMGLKPSSRVLALAVEEAQPDAALSLQLPPDNRRVTRVVRIRMANDLPILLETTLIPEYLCPGLVEEDFAKGSLYRILSEERRLSPHHAEETYEAVVLSRRDAQLLGCPSRGAQPAFAIQRLTYLENGRPIELTRSVGRGDRLTLAINMTSEQADVQRRVEFP
ncbi:MAG TPA: GntR family transcriptional regulator [Spirochaetia bacterium]|nr:GntR family transcriptional regulator [Spirochaetia bacterium]